MRTKEKNGDMGEENVWCWSISEQPGLVRQSHELLESKVAYKPARGPQIFVGMKKIVQNPLHPFYGLWKPEALLQVSAHSSGPSSRSLHLLNCLLPTHQPWYGSSAFFIFHNQKVKLPYSTLLQIHELYQNVPSRFTFSLLPPMSALTQLLISTHPAPNFSPFITKNSFLPFTASPDTSSQAPIKTSL